MPDITDLDNPEKNETPALSKSALKRQMTALQAVGERLISLSNAQFSQFSLSEPLLEAIALYKRLKHREARRRQLQLIGKLMRNEDNEHIEQTFAHFDAHDKVFHQHFHATEILRDELTSGGDQVLTDLLNKHPNLDNQFIRQMIRQVKKEQSLKKPPASSRKLFRYLRDNINPL